MKKIKKITDIKISKNSINKRKIYVNNGFFIETEDVIISELDLYVGKVIDKNIADILTYKDLFSKAKNDSIRFLSYRQRSEQEISIKLKNKNYPMVIVKDIIEWLKNKNLINDTEFSLTWIKDRMINKPMGKLKIRTELYKKGIDKKIIDKTINIIFKNDNYELELANNLIQKKKESLFSKGIEIENKKILNLLKNRGFSYEIINQIIDELEQ